MKLLVRGENLTFSDEPLITWFDTGAVSMERSQAPTGPTCRPDGGPLFMVTFTFPGLVFSLNHARESLATGEPVKGARLV